MLPVVIVVFLLARPVHAQDLGVNLGPVVQSDRGWVSNLWAGPWCDFFSMAPSGRTWAIPRGTPMHDGVLAGAMANMILYKLSPGPSSLVVVSASTSPPLPGSSHIGYDQVPVGQPSQTVCGGGNVPYFHLMDSAIAILPANGY